MSGGYIDVTDKVASGEMHVPKSMEKHIDPRSYASAYSAKAFFNESANSWRFFVVIDAFDGDFDHSCTVACPCACECDAEGKVKCVADSAVEDYNSTWNKKEDMKKVEAAWTPEFVHYMDQVTGWCGNGKGPKWNPKFV